jgi:O-antigen ligase
MMRNVLLGAGLLLTMATQLRIGGLPIGPGEILLTVWIALGLLNPRRASVERTRARASIALFWSLFAIAQGAGMMMGFASEPFLDVGSIVHDIGAYALASALALMIAHDLADEARRTNMVWTMLAISCSALAAQLLQGAGMFAVPGVEPWFYNRFQGWSADANQLGLLSSVVFMLAMFAADRASNRRELAAALFVCGVALTSGFLTRSDSFMLSIAVAISAFVWLKCWEGLLRPARNARTAFATCAFWTLPAVLVSAAPFAPDALAMADAFSKSVYEDNGQGDTRLTLWKEAYAKGMESVFVGYGPGPHLTAKSFKRPPPDKFEAHNTFLDLLTQGGVLGVLAFCGLIGAAIHGGLQARAPTLVALCCGLLIFSLFHFVVRQPIFWFALALCLLEADSARRLHPDKPGPLTHPVR